jgi:hypothetical protein
VQLCNIIHLNHPEVWTFRRGTRWVYSCC